MKKDESFYAKPRQRGFTILELMVAVAIGAILVVIAIPSFNDTIRRNRIDGEAQKIYGLIKQARTNAMMTNSPSFICRSRRDGTTRLACQSGAVDANDWGVQLKLYTALTATNVPLPNASYGNQRLQRLEGDNGRKRQMLQKSLEAPVESLVVTSARNDLVLRFNADGTVSNTTPFRIAICDDDVNNPERYGQLIEINQSGQLRLTRVSLTDTDRDCTPRA